MDNKRGGGSQAGQEEGRITISESKDKEWLELAYTLRLGVLS